MTLTNKLLIFLLALLGAGAVSSSSFTQKSPLKVLIVDGQNNHEQWPKITAMMKYYLEDTKKFSVDIQRTRYTWQGDKLVQEYPVKNGPETQALKQPKMDSAFHPQFSNYDVVICN